MQQKPTAAQQIAQLNEALVSAFVKREDAQKQIDMANEAILAIRNTLGGVKHGQELQTEILAEQAELEAAKKHAEAIRYTEPCKLTVPHK